MNVAALQKAQDDIRALQDQADTLRAELHQAKLEANALRRRRREDTAKRHHVENVLAMAMAWVERFGLKGDGRVPTFYSCAAALGIESQHATARRRRRFDLRGLVENVLDAARQDCEPIGGDRRRCFIGTTRIRALVDRALRLARGSAPADQNAVDQDVADELELIHHEIRDQWVELAKTRGVEAPEPAPDLHDKSPAECEELGREAAAREAGVIGGNGVEDE